MSEHDTLPPESDELTKTRSPRPERVVADDESQRIFQNIVQGIVGEAVERAVGEAVERAVGALVKETIQEAVSAAVKAAFAEMRSHINEVLTVVERTAKLEDRADKADERIEALERWRRSVEQAAE